MTSITVFYALFFITLLAAWIWGGKPERIGGAIHLALACLQGAFYLVVPPSFASLDGISLLTDALGLAGFGWLALAANRMWPIWAASLQLLSLAGHFARWAQLEIAPYAYSLLRTAPTALGLLVLLLAVVVHRKRLKQSGQDRPWVDWRALRKNHFAHLHRKS